MSKLFKAIGHFIDKKIVLPIAKFFTGISKKFKGNGRNFEKILTMKPGMIIVSLLIALGVFFIADSKTTSLIETSAEVLYDQPISATYNEEAYVVEGLPKTVDITLVGQKRHIFLAKQSPSEGVTVDLTGLKPGQHKVTLKYSQRLKSLDYRLDPSTVTVTIYDKVSATRTLTYDVLHKDNLDSKLNIEKVELDRSEVIIKGAEQKLKKVATVKALVDVDDFANPEPGEMTLKNVQLVAYDTNGKVVDVEIVPKSVTAKVTITSPSKEVPLKIVPKGDLAFGKAIKSLSTSINNVTIYGSEESLASISSLPVEIDVTGLEKSKDYTVTLKKTTGVTDISAKTVTVKVVIDDSTVKEFQDISIATENLDTSKYKVQASSEADSKVTVVVKGSKSIIDNIDQSIIKAYVDLKDLGPGDHEVEVKVTGDDVKLTYTPKVKKVKIKISPK